MTTNITALVEGARTRTANQACWRQRVSGKPLEFILAVEDEMAQGVSFTAVGITRGFKALGFAVNVDRVSDHLKERCDCER